MDSYICTPWHLAHVAPIIHALDPSLRGRLYVGFDAQMPAHAARYGLDAHQGHPPPSDVPVLVASGNELPVVQRAILAEHGVGQTYGSEVDHICWPGGPSRENVALFLCPNQNVASANRARYPDTTCAVVGSPHVEMLRRQPPYPLAEPRVALSCHWEAWHLVPELRGGWSWFESAYEEMCRASPEAFVLHGHPKHQDYTEWKAREWGVAFEPNFENLTQRAWCYVTDNSSTTYEWAALNRPVVTVSPPWYRRDVNHGLRFWNDADVGPQVFEPAELESAIYTALADPAPAMRRRQEIVRALFGDDLSEGAAKRAAHAIAEVIGC